MRLKVLGCRAGMPADGAAGSGDLVTTASTSVLLDCGPGVATAFSAVEPTPLSGVVISHLHLDHCYDLLPVGRRLLAATTPYPGDPGRPAGTHPLQIHRRIMATGAQGRRPARLRRTRSPGRTEP